MRVLTLNCWYSTIVVLGQIIYWSYNPQLNFTVYLYPCRIIFVAGPFVSGRFYAPDLSYPEPYGPDLLRPGILCCTLYIFDKNYTTKCTGRLFVFGKAFKIWIRLFPPPGTFASFNIMHYSAGRWTPFWEWITPFPTECLPARGNFSINFEYRFITASSS